MVEDAIPPEFSRPGEPAAETAPPAPKKSGGLLSWPRSAVLGPLAGLLLLMAITVQVRAWSSVATETHGHCGGGYPPCPAGTVPALLLSFFALFALIPLTPVLLFANLGRGAAGKLIGVVTALAGVLGVFVGNALYTGTHGPGPLRVAWQLPLETNPSLDGKGSWLVGDTVIRARADEVTAYDIATGRSVWSYTVPDPELICGVSRGTAGRIGLIAFGTQEGHCDQATALDLNTGHELWTKALVADSLPGSDTADFVADFGDAAFVAAPGTDQSQNGVAAYDLRTGAPRWHDVLPDLCQPEAVGGSFTLLMRCVVEPTRSAGARDVPRITYTVRQYDPETGVKQWESPVGYRGTNANVDVLSFAPLTLRVRETDARGTDRVLSFSPSGAQQSAISVAADGMDLNSSGFQADPNREVVVADGILVCRAQLTGSHANTLVGYNLATGAKVWTTPIRLGSLSGLALDGERVVAVQESGFVENLTAYDLHTGAAQVIGSADDDLNTDEAMFYATGGYYLLVGANGHSYPPILALH